ncbi:class I SAM-dependent methyltransferase [Streptosporangium sp. NPDC051023]|uniref:class I SAM-dependent methyltransferase n=1 Tax=Streptosporangium sp. NPDC051023 TaxID=3155410 RepID=UPI00344FBCFA
MDDPTPSTTASYDHIADAYAEQWKQPSPEIARLLERFTERLPQGARVADLGSGPGRDTRWLADRGVVAVAVDRSVSMLGIAAGRGVPVIRGDLRYPPFAPASLNGIWAIASLLHVPSDQTVGTLRRWRQVLRPRGVLGLSTSLGDDEGWEKVPYATTTPQPESLHRWFVHRRPEALLDALTEAGFQVQEHETRVSRRTWLQVIAQRADSL